MNGRMSLFVNERIIRVADKLRGYHFVWKGQTGIFPSTNHYSLFYNRLFKIG